MGAFDEAITARPVGEGRYEIRPDERFAIAGAVNGGVLLASMLRAVLDASPHPYPIATSAHFLRAPRPEPAQVEVEWLKQGKVAATARATLVQGGHPMLETTVTTGTLGDPDDAGALSWTGEPPRLPPIEECRDIQDAQIYQRAIAQSARILTEWITRTEQSLREELRVQQWVEIEVKDGRTITTCSPSNEQVMKDAAKRSERPLFLTRTLNFQRGIPPQYDWACHTDMQQTFPCIARQTVLYSQWLDVIEREKSTPGGHLGPLDWLFDD